MTIKTLLLLFLSSLAPVIPSSLFAQREVPHRDFAKVDSTNSGKVTPPDPTVIKKGYSFISREDGLYYQEHLDRYLRDSLGFGSVDFDSIVYNDAIDSLCFYLPDTTFCTFLSTAAVDGWTLMDGVTSPDDDLDSIQRRGYIELNGESNGEPSKISLLREGVLVFDKQQFADDVGDYLIRIHAFDTLNAGITFNLALQSNQTIQDTTFNTEAVNLGWNVAPGGGLIVGGKSGMSLFWEYNWANPNDSGNIWDEWQLRWIEPDGTQHRPLDFAMKVGNLAGSEAAIRMPKIDLSPLDTTAWYMQFQYSPASTQILHKFANPLTGNGYQWILDEDDNNVSVSQFGLTTPTFDINGFDSIYAGGKLSYAINAGTPLLPVGRDAGGYFSEFSWQDLADSVEVYDPHIWEDFGGSIRPALGQTAYIPSSFAGTGALNVIGRIDPRFPSSTLSNIAIGPSAGNASLTADNNIYIGSQAGEANTAGVQNVFIGLQAGLAYTGSNAVAIGNLAMQTNVSGDGNVAIGDRALQDATAGNNVAIGAQSGLNISTAANNLAIGTTAFPSLTTGGNNVGIGTQTGNNTQTGIRNVFIGSQAGYGNGAANNASSDNVMIGYQSGFSNAGTGNLFLGWASGWNETGSNKLYIENSTSTTPLIKGDFAADSVLINGKLGFTTSAGPALMLAGLRGTQFTRTSIGPGLQLIDNELSLIDTPGDSVFQDTTLGVCIISMGDTLCSDTFYVDIDGQQMCVVIDGDTTCADYYLPVNLATADLIQTDDVRVYDVGLGKQLQFRRAAPPFGVVAPVFRIMPHDNSANIRIDAFTSNPAVSTLALQNWASDGDIFLHWNGQSAQDYSFGIDASRAAFVISEGDNLSTPIIDMYSLGDSISIQKDMQVNAGLLDKDGDYGTSGQVLSTTGTEVNWIDPPAGSAVPISDLEAAADTNIINNADYTQEWQWNTLDSTGFKLTSTSTAAVSNMQRLLEVAISGANATTTQTTHAGYFSNTHTGTNATNYAVYGTITNGVNSSAAIRGEATSQYAVHGNATSGIGVRGNATTGHGVYGLATAGFGVRGAASAGWGVWADATGDSATPITVTDESSNTNQPEVMISMARSTSGTAAAGIGASITWGIETATSTATANTITSKWLDATHATRYSQCLISGVKNGTTADIIYFEGDRSTKFNGRAQTRMGAAVASANDLTLGYDGNSFHITGTTQINAITSTDWQNGSIIRLLFDASVTVKDNTAGGGATVPIILAGSVDFAATADDVLTLMLDSTRWVEVSRSAN